MVTTIKFILPKKKTLTRIAQKDLFRDSLMKGSLKKSTFSTRFRRMLS
jgi:hypothetical protein